MYEPIDYQNREKYPLFSVGEKVRFRDTYKERGKDRIPKAFLDQEHIVSHLVNYDDFGTEQRQSVRINGISKSYSDYWFEPSFPTITKESLIEGYEI